MKSSMVRSFGNMHEFIVNEVEQKDWEEISILAEEWSLLANRKHQHGGGSIFTESSAISFFALGRIECALDKEKDVRLEERGESWDTILVCKDRATMKAQSFALYDKKKNSLLYLVTHPDNIRDRINERLVAKVQGAGTAVILHLAGETVRADGLPLTLSSVLSAKQFYKKLSFDEGGATVDGKCVRMTLTVEKIRRLITKGIHPFHQL